MADINAAERQRIRAIMAAMEVGSLTPDAAAVAVDVQGAPWMEVLQPRTGETAVSAPGLAGGLRTEGGGWWVAVARVEGEQSAYAEGERVTHEDLLQMTRSYDPEYRRAEVLMPSQRGSSHYASEYGWHVAGHVAGLAYDGHHLWALLESRSRELEYAVAMGAEQRSIRYWRRMPELEGEPPYLRHLALLAGEPPGVPNLPPLTEWVEGGGLPSYPGEPNDVQRERYIERSLTLNLQEGGQTMQTTTPASGTPPRPDQTPPAEGDRTPPVTLETIRQTMRRLVGLGDSVPDSAPTPSTETRTTPPASAPAGLPEEVRRAVAALQESNRQLVSAVLEPMAAMMERMESERAERSTSERRQRVVEVISAAVREGRVVAAQARVLEQTLPLLEGEALDEALRTVATSPPLLTHLRAGLELVTEGEGGQRLAEVNGRFRAPDGSHAPTAAIRSLMGGA